MATFEKGTWAWLQDEDECYVPVQAVLAFKAGSAATVRSQDGRERELSAAQTAEGSLAAMDEQSLTPQANMVNFDELTEAALLHNLTGNAAGLSGRLASAPQACHLPAGKKHPRSGEIGNCPAMVECLHI